MPAAIFKYASAAMIPPPPPTPPGSDSLQQVSAEPEASNPRGQSDMDQAPAAVVPCGWTRVEGRRIRGERTLMSDDVHSIQPKGGCSRANQRVRGRA